MKIEEFRGINPVISVDGLNSTEERDREWYLVRLDWILLIVVLTIIAVLVA